MPKRKVVLDEKEGSVVVGVMAEGCDPVLRHVEGTLENALGAIPQVLQEAQQRWLLSPRNPAYKPPTPPRPATQPRPQPAASPVGDLPLLAGTEEEPAVAKAQAAPVPSQVVAPTAEPAPPQAVAPTAEVATEEPVEVKAEPLLSGLGRYEGEVPTRKKRGEVEFFLADGRGPFSDVQAAMDALGLPKDKRPQHNRYDRLSDELKKSIQQRPAPKS